MWDMFERHCESTEVNPLKIYFCNDCGDSLARHDSLQRHFFEESGYMSLMICENAIPISSPILENIFDITMTSL